jgi:hypothetical protein
MSGKPISIGTPPAALRPRSRERGVVGDRADDGQSEAVVVVDAGAVESLEGLEEAVDHSQSQCHGGDAGNLPN